MFTPTPTSVLLFLFSITSVLGNPLPDPQGINGGTTPTDPDPVSPSPSAAPKVVPNCYYVGPDNIKGAACGWSNTVVGGVNCDPTYLYGFDATNGQHKITYISPCPDKDAQGRSCLGGDGKPDRCYNKYVPNE